MLVVGYLHHINGRGLFGLWSLRARTSLFGARHFASVSLVDELLMRKRRFRGSGEVSNVGKQVRKGGVRVGRSFLDQGQAISLARDFQMNLREALGNLRIANEQVDRERFVAEASAVGTVLLEREFVDQIALAKEAVEPLARVLGEDLEADANKIVEAASPSRGLLDRLPVHVVLESVVLEGPNFAQDRGNLLGNVAAQRGGEGLAHVVFEHVPRQRIAVFDGTRVDLSDERGDEGDGHRSRGRRAVIFFVALRLFAGALA